MTKKIGGSGRPKMQFFLLNAYDFSVDTQRYTPTEVGCLMRLMCDQWINDSLPKEIPRLAQICGVTPSEMKEIWSSISSKFHKRSDGTFVNSRLEREKKRVQLKGKAAKKAAEARWRRATDDGGSMQTHMQNECEPDADGMGTKNKEQRTKIKKEEPVTFGDVSSVQRKRNKPCPVQKIVDLYNLTCLNLPKVKVLTAKRKTILRARWKEHNTLRWWKKYFEYVAKQPFLNGKNKTDWTANFDWVINESNMAKISEGNYERENHGRN